MLEALPPDELGDAGEDLFRSLCSRARLTCNKSERDRTGWDFRVEFKMDDADGVTLDQRSPRAAQIQLKCTAGESGTRVTARLSSIERLAKDAAPAAVVVFRMKPDGTPLMGYLIPLIDHELSRILHRLRRAEADGRHDVNHMTISFDYLKGRRFKPTPEGLREALAAASPVNVHAYTEKKREQLATLGYEGGGIEADALVWIESPNHLTRILSGIEPLKPLRLQAYDRRFDIRVPYRGDLLNGVEEISIQLPLVGPCEIVIRGGPRKPAAVYRCEAFAPPPIEGGPLMVIKHDVLSALFTDDGLQIETTGNFDETPRSLDDWILLLRGLAYMASGIATMEFEFRGTRLSQLAVPSGGLQGPHTEDLPRLLEFTERWKEANALAGTVPWAAFSLAEIWDANAVQMGLDMILNPHPLARLEFDVIEGADDEMSLEALYFNTIGFAQTAITFAVRVTLDRVAKGAVGFVSTGFDLIDIRPGVLDLDAYGAELATINEIQIVINPSNLVVVDRPLLES
ncbi:hypothetical protein [Rhizorhabdus phycosphaerae]|uniref:hypothetical protein n=1 Tax=Rhizorhabdus phycosphaerae TaxID=2711156 RepID=UPI0013EC715B|nr:hypothetical protein [Rhizorhabdus phycosphaerae]